MQFQTTTFRKNNKKRRVSFKYSLLFAISCILIFSGCGDNFQPLKENTLYNFNISGYLDASADTQWVRVGTIRESINEPPNPDGIEVTLKDLQSGETVMMNDSVFTSRNFLNYWTTMDIKHEQTYRITVKGTDGKISEVTLTTPSELPSVYVILHSEGTTIYIDDTAEQIIDLQSVWYVTLNSGTEIQRIIYRFPIRNTLQYTSSFFGAYYAFSNRERELAQIEQRIGGAEIAATSRQFFVASAGPEWNDSLSTIDNLEYFINGTASNVENGLGYVVGISSGWYRQATCLNDEGSGYAPCPREEAFW